MQRNINAFLTKQRFSHARRPASDCLSTFNLLTSDGLFDEIERLLPAHRERLFPPTETLAMFVTQALSADRSCQSVVNQAAVQRLISGLPGCSTHTGGYCRARQRLPQGMVTGLTQHLGQHVAQQVPKRGCWQGRRVYLVDGTTVTLPDTPANQTAYPQSRAQKPGLGFPICRLVGLTCLFSGALVNAATGRCSGKGGDEQTLFRTIQDTLTSGDILLGDAFYPTYFLIASLQANGIDILMEQHGSRKRSTDFDHGVQLGQRDHLVAIHKPKRKPDWMSEEAYQGAPDSLTVREFKASGKIMITTLRCPKKASKTALKVLYKQRWSVELDIRDIKTTMGMEILTCQTPEMAIKELWVYLLAYNLIRFLMLQAALNTGCMARDLSFKHCVQLWHAWSQFADTYDAQLEILYLMIAQQRVGNRPGRIEPRVVKRRPKPYPLMMQPREQAREQVRQYGHPKKLK